MKLVTAPMTIKYAGGHEIPANTRVVLPEGAVPELRRALALHGHEPRVSALGHYLKQYHGQDLNGKRLFAWRGFGIGDQLVYGGLLRILKDRYPDTEIDFCVWPPLFKALWSGEMAVPLPFNVVQEPLSFEQWRSYDYHLHGEGLCEADREPDQPDIWTGHIQSVGLDPETVSVGERIPVVPLRQEDHSAALQWRKRHVGTIYEPFVLWQLGSSTPIRSYRPDLTEKALRLLSERLPEVKIAVTGHPSHFSEYTIPVLPNVVSTDGMPLRAVMALGAMASCIACPDSCLGHVAAAFRTPCVSLWSSFLPTDRVGSYRSHRPVVGEIECSPCRHHEKGNKAQGCPRTIAGELPSRYCDGLARIAPERIVEAVQKELS
ncbi:MAG: hypothetical protein HON70_06370 [Lentisphaerae bacterium]|nr:hypothetical protein [Lentisphaerota bacterium]